MATVLLVHGAFAESASWNGVAERLTAAGHDVVAVANPLRSLQAALMYATQRPITQAALSTGLPTDQPAWKSIPSWFVFSDQDLNIPVALHRFLAERAGARGVREIAGASHALSVSQPTAVAETILEAAK